MNDSKDIAEAITTSLLKHLYDHEWDDCRYWTYRGVLEKALVSCPEVMVILAAEALRDVS